MTANRAAFERWWDGDGRKWRHGRVVHELADAAWQAAWAARGNEAELARVREESAGRLKRLNEVAEERTANWKRAENAEAERDALRERVALLEKYVRGRSGFCSTARALLAKVEDDRCGTCSGLGGASDPKGGAWGDCPDCNGTGACAKADKGGGE